MAEKVIPLSHTVADAIPQAAIRSLERQLEAALNRIAQLEQDMADALERIEALEP